MSTSTAERTGDWESVPFPGGFAGLRDLADDDFSGMVTAGPTRLFMTRGAVVGVLDGDIEDFADGGGTAREAPHPALPLLAVMQERSEEVRAQYYTEETPLSEVDRTLADGNFTGYVELSENVLSGDYYQVYHQGRSMSVAYVGASERLITDDEAFEQADDEVGIYEVRPVDVDIVDVPAPAGDDTAGGSTGGGDSGAVDDPDSGTDDPAGREVAGEATDAGTAADPDGPTGGAGTESRSPSPDRGGVEEAGETAGGTASTEGSPSSASEPDRSETATSEPPSSESTTSTQATVDDETGAEPARSDSTTTGSTATESVDEREGATTRSEPDSTAGAEADASASGGTASTESTTADSGTSAAPSGASTDPATGRADSGTDPSHDRNDAGGRRQGQPAPDHPAVASRERDDAADDRGTAPDAEGTIGAGDLEVHSLPSLDPSRTASASRQERERRAAGGGAATEPAQSRQPESRDAPSQSGQAGGASDAADRNARSGTAGGAGGTPTEDADTGGAPATAERATDVPEETAPSAAAADAGSASEEGTASTDLAEAQAEVERLEAELADLRGDHEAVVEERDRLQTELAEAREEIERLRDRLEDAAGSGAEASRTLSPREAIDETNLFIRYDSKGEATLEEAHAGEVDHDAVDGNMRLEYHTSFDADDAAVDGVDFDTFLTDTVQYRFVDWLVRKLLYEIRDTGNTGPMAELYDALPKVDRAELNGQVGVQYTEDGQEHRAQVGFDVIVRDRMGNPLIVANLNDSRDPATDSMMTDLVRAAERVGESSQSLAGAFLVTRSFFEPGALETAEEATAGGLLNRGKQKSFVNLSRKGGYHLCLVEARNQEFHLAVPEL